MFMINIFRITLCNMATDFNGNFRSLERGQLLAMCTCRCSKYQNGFKVSNSRKKMCNLVLHQNITELKVKVGYKMHTKKLQTKMVRKIQKIRLEWRQGLRTNKFFFSFCLTDPKSEDYSPEKNKTRVVRRQQSSPKGNQI